MPMVARSKNRLRFRWKYQVLRAVWPAHKPMSVRISATDWADAVLSATTPC